MDKMETTNDKNTVLVAPAALPDGNGSFVPCPQLLTEAEAIRYLRLDVDGPAKPENTLRYYREKKKLRPTQIGRRLFYSRKELDRFIEKMTRD